MKTQIKKLTTILGMGGLDGSIAIAALAGLFSFKNIPLIVFVFLAGPVAMLSATLVEGPIHERMIVALISGVLATGMIILSAGFGPVLLEHVNISIMKVTGGIALIAIAFLIMGFKIPENVPIMIILSGLIVGVLLK